MKFDIRQPTLRLESGEILRMRNAREVLLEVRSGRVWLTTEGHGGDAFLRAGERLPLSVARLIVIESLGDAEIRFSTAERRGAALPATVAAMFRAAAHACVRHLAPLDARRRAAC